jgi:cell fate (sporulation/competence/biofilm development) regulator YlbF (YheA/YmcA/DUF963 family)
MTDNLFEMAYNFEKVFRQSGEYKSLRRLYSEVIADPATKNLFNRVNKLQIKLEKKQMMGQEISQQEVEEFQKTLTVAQQNNKIAQLMEADHRVNMLIMELNKVITKPLEDLYNRFEERY